MWEAGTDAARPPHDPPSAPGRTVPCLVELWATPRRYMVRTSRTLGRTRCCHERGDRGARRRPRRRRVEGRSEPGACRAGLPGPGPWYEIRTSPSTTRTSAPPWARPWPRAGRVAGWRSAAPASASASPPIACPARAPPAATTPPTSALPGSTTTPTSLPWGRGPSASKWRRDCLAAFLDTPVRRRSPSPPRRQAGVGAPWPAPAWRRLPRAATTSSRRISRATTPTCSRRSRARFAASGTRSS